MDIIAILTNQDDFQKARKYWNKLKERLVTEGNETVTNCHQLKMISTDGKMRLSASVFCWDFFYCGSKKVPEPYFEFR